MNEDKELLERAEKIRKGYKSLDVDEQEEQLSFLDEINGLIRSILGGEPIDVYTLLKEDELDKWKKSKFKRSLKKAAASIFNTKSLYFILLSTITLFLVWEAIPFYAVAGQITFKTYLKACLTEVCFIFLSGFRAVGYTQTALVSILRVSIFCLMLFVITSEVALEGAQDISKIDNISSRVARLEQQIATTEKDIKRYREINWPTNMTISIRKREKLEEELQALKLRQEQEGASKNVSNIIQYKVYGKAAFRLILMFISVLITRRLWKF